MSKSRYYFGISIKQRVSCNKLNCYFVSNASDKTFIGVCTDTKPSEEEFEEVISKIFYFLKELNLPDDQFIGTFYEVNRMNPQQNIA